MNPAEMAKALALIKPEGIVEVRSFGRRVMSGYFKDREKLIKAVSAYPNETFYLVMNDINEACYAREQCERLIEVGKQDKTTSDKEIERIRWVLIDVDPNRPSGVSASNEEKAASRDTIRSIYRYLRGQGFSEPICADSGNGYHLLYSVNLQPENSEIIRDFLKVLNMYFSDEKVSVDTSVFNPARITKLYGTTATKGTATEDRPHRESAIARFESPVKQTSITLFQKIAGMLPKPKTQAYGQQYVAFDARGFLTRNGVGIAREASFKDGTKLILDACPFDQNHRAPDSAVFLFDDGRIGFKCFHNSCSEYRWSDVRKKFDANYQTYQPRVYTAHEILPPAPKPKEEPADKFLRMSDIQPIDRSKIVVVKTRFEGIDKKIGGFNLGEMSVWSGASGCVTADTEYFNGKQWKPISEYTKGEQVLQYNADGTAALVTPSKYHMIPMETCEFMYRITNHTKSLVQEVSVNHTMVYRTSKGNIAKCAAYAFVSKLGEKKRFAGTIIPHFRYAGHGVDWTDDMIRLFVAVSADGSLPRRKKKQVVYMRLKKEHKKERLEILLDACGISYGKHKYTPSDREFDTYSFNVPFQTKVFPKEWYDFDRHQMDVFLDEVFRWDGRIDGKGRTSYFSTVKENADFVQFMITASGKRASILQDDRAGCGVHKSICYQVIQTRAKGGIHLSTSNGIFIETLWGQKYKYCFTVPSGMLVLRRENAINITGNSGKSTFLEQLALETVQGGFNAVLFSGELTGKRCKYWLQLQAAGASGVRPAQDGISYYVPGEIGKAIDGWLNDRLWLYNNDYGNQAKAIIDDFKRHMDKNKTHVVIIDNLMSMDMGGGDKYEGQTRLVLALSQMAKDYDVHIHFVCHPRKPTGFLRKADISGTADITNAADNVMMMHRVNDDFKKGSADFFGSAKSKQYDGFSNVVEIMKNRDLGVEDELIGLYFDPKTKQMQSERNQNRGYGWMDDYSDCPF